MSPRVTLTFDGRPDGAVGAARKVSGSLSTLKTETKALAAENLAAAGTQAKLSQAVAVTDRETRRHATSVASAEKEVSRLSRGALAGSGIFHGYGRSIAFASAAFLGGAGLTSVLRSAFDTMEQGQVVAAQTNAALKSTGAVAGITAKGIDDLAHAEARKSGADATAVRTAENLLLTFRYVRNEAGKGNDVFDQAVKQADNLSRAWGVDLNTAAATLGKALNNPFTGYVKLQRQGVTFTNQQKEQIKQFQRTGDVVGAQRVILDELNREIGNSAKNYGQTLPGAIGRARNSIHEIEGDLLKGLSPALKDAADSVGKWAEKERQSGDLQRQVNAVVQEGANDIRGIVGALREAKSALDPVVQSFGGWKNVTEGLIALKLASTVLGWAGAFGKADTKAGGLLGTLNRLKLLGPIAITVAINEAIKKTTGFDPIHEAVTTKTAGGAGDLLPIWNGKAWVDPTNGRPVPDQAYWNNDYRRTHGGRGPSDATKGSSVGGYNPQTFDIQHGIVATAQRVMQGPYSRYVYGGGGAAGASDSAARHDSFHFKGFDCSGFVQYVMAQNGIQVPRTSQEQAAGGVAVPTGELAPGDLVFTEGWPHPGHVGIYIGGGQIIEDPHTGASIRTTTVAAFGITGARRYWKKGSTVAKPSAGGGTGGKFTPQNPADFKKTPKATKVAVTALSGPTRLGIALAAGTSGLADDIAANQAAVDELTVKLGKATKSGVKADLVDAINGYRDAIKSARKTLLEELPGGLKIRIAKAAATRGLQDDIDADLAAIKYLKARLKQATDQDVRTDLITAIAGFQGSLNDAQKQAASGREKAARAARAAAERLAAVSQIRSAFAVGRATIGQAESQNLLPADEEARINGQVSRFAQLVRKVERDGKISPSELKAIKSSWGALSKGISDASQAVRQAAEEAQARTWQGITDRIGRALSESWATTQRDFGRETDRGVKAINDQATADIEQMSRDFETQMVAFGRETDRIVKEQITDPADAEIAQMARTFQARMAEFNRETQAGLKALEVLQTPTEALLAQRQAGKDAADTVARLADLTKARDDAVAAEAAAATTLGGVHSRGAESLAAYNQRLKDAQEGLKSAAADRVAAQRALDDELFNEETTSLQARADAERKAADAQTAAAQDAYQQARDDLAQSLQDQEKLLEDARRSRASDDEQAYRQQREDLARSLQDQETVRERARQTQADVAIQAYQDERDAQWQHMNDMHDDALSQLNRDLAQWATWIANKQKTYAQFLEWLRNNPAVADTGGPSAFDAAVDAIPDYQPTDTLGGPGTYTSSGGQTYFQSNVGTYGKKPLFASGGRVPGRYVGVQDSVIARVTPGEEVIDRSTAAALRAFLANPGRFAGGGGSGPVILQVDGREFARLTAVPMRSAQASIVSYKSPSR